MSRQYMHYLRSRARYEITPEGKILAVFLNKRGDTVTREILPDPSGKFVAWHDNKQRICVLVDNRITSIVEHRRRLRDEARRRDNEIRKIRSISEKQSKRDRLMNLRLSEGYVPLVLLPGVISDRYLINEDSQVWDILLAKRTPDYRGYKEYRIVNIRHGNHRKSYNLHRLMGFTFLSESYFEGAEIDHVDGVKNNNHVSNLRWVTHKQNMEAYQRRRNAPKIRIL